MFIKCALIIGLLDASRLLCFLRLEDKRTLHYTLTQKSSKQLHNTFIMNIFIYIIKIKIEKIIKSSKMKRVDFCSFS